MAAFYKVALVFRVAEFHHDGSRAHFRANGANCEGLTVARIGYTYRTQNFL